MRFLFYLPVVTPWWFETVIVPLMAKLADEHDVHVLAPSPWSGTGVGPQEINLCAHMPDVRWHIVNDTGHPSMRTAPLEREGLIAFVKSLEPDYVLCRSADFETVKEFPGIVRHITEGGVDPLALPGSSVQFTECPFDHGVLPALGADAIAELDQLIEPFWLHLPNAPRLDGAQRKYLIKWANLPTDRPVLFFPLEYEHEENFYTQHRVGAQPNARLVEEIAQEVGDRAFLAITNHPLNELHVDNTALKKVVKANASKMRLLPGKSQIGFRTSTYLSEAADAVLLGDSKLYSLAGYYGTPIVRRSRFKTGEWLNAYTEIDELLDALAEESCVGPDLAFARIWFAFHIANNLFTPKSPDLTAAEIVQRLETPVDRKRWQRNFAYFSQGWTRAAA